MDSTYHHPLLDCSFSADIEWDTETESEMEKRIERLHLRWHEAQHLQLFSVESWSKESLDDVSSQALQQKAIDLLENCHRLLSYHDQLNPDVRHLLETALPNDLDQMLHAFVSLSNEAKEKHVPSVIERLNTMQAQLQVIEAHIDTQKERDLTYAFRVIDSKYASTTKEIE